MGRHQWNPTGIFVGASAAQYIQEWSVKENGEEIKFSTGDKFFMGGKTKVDCKKNFGKTLQRPMIETEDKTADGI